MKIITPFIVFPLLWLVMFRIMFFLAGAEWSIPSEGAVASLVLGTMSSVVYWVVVIIEEAS